MARNVKRTAIAADITELIGGTPLLRLARYEKAHGLGSDSVLLGK